MAGQGEGALNRLLRHAITQGGPHGAGEGGIAARVKAFIGLTGAAVTGLGNRIQPVARDAGTDIEHTAAQCAFCDAPQLRRGGGAAGVNGRGLWPDWRRRD